MLRRIILMAASVLVLTVAGIGRLKQLMNRD